jgi:ketosteroid isomerase-like protein
MMMAYSPGLFKTLLIIKPYFMEAKTFVQDMYRIVDAKDARCLAALMTENGIFRFANQAAVQGREAIIAYLGNFYRSIADIAHDRIEDWQTGDTRFATGWVKYTRHDRSELSVPFSVLLRMKGELISEYLIFVDASELYR